jgi:hypothetical protein
MGIVRRCGRPPRPGPLIVKPTRERMQLLGRARVAPSASPGFEALASLAGPRRDSRELDAAATARLVAATPLAPGLLERRPPPRIPAGLGTAAETVAQAERDAAGDDVVCGCPRHRQSR